MTNEWPSPIFSTALPAAPSKVSNLGKRGGSRIDVSGTDIVCSHSGCNIPIRISASYADVGGVGESCSNSSISNISEPREETLEREEGNDWGAKASKRVQA
jgi:hypothetical protein